MKKLGLFLAICLGLMLVGCLDKFGFGEKNLIEQPKFLLNPGLGFGVKPKAIVLNNQLAFLLGEKRGLVFYQGTKETLLTHEQTSNQWLHDDGRNLYAFWWAVDKQKAKFLKVRVSSDQGTSFSPAVILNQGTGVLPDISIASNKKGAVAIAYTDERKPGYGVYVNYSIDNGATWSKEDLRLDTPVITSAMKMQQNEDPATFANSPHLSYLDDKLVAVWQQVDMTEMGQSMLRLVSKTSNDFGKTWDPDVNIFVAPNMQPVEFTSFNNGKEMYIFAMLTGDGGKGFTGFYTTDSSAKQWGEISNSALGEGYDKALVSWIKGAFSGDNLVLTFTVEQLPNSPKLHADVATLSTKDHQWVGKARHLDADKGHDITKSTYPDVLDAGELGVYLVWEDYRTLVPSIYLNVSKDHGKTWSETPKALTTPGLSVAKDPRLLLGTDKLWMTYFMVQLNGKNSNGSRVYQEFLKDSDSFVFPVIDTTKPDLEKLKVRLIERANKFWALREEKKWEETWDYMEPVYRERFDKAEWLAQQGKISFSKTVVDENSINIIDNLAILNANVDVSVTQQVSKEGLLESAPPKQQTVEMKWGWFYDDWYFMPDVIFGNHLEY